MGHTFDDPKKIVETLAQERPGTRDIAFYVMDPHVILASSPQTLFLDPSHTYRLWLGGYQPAPAQRRGFRVRRMRRRTDAVGVSELYTRRQMVPVSAETLWSSRTSQTITSVVADDRDSGAIIGTVTGIDHLNAFDDAEHGSSLWCLAVDPQAPYPGVGEALVRYLVEHFQARGRQYLDLSVIHSNHEAIALYEKLGFQRVSVFAIKRRNAINEPLYTGPRPEQGLNPYASIVAEEARRRGIDVEVLDAEQGYLRLSFGGRSIVCRESLSELTSAVAMSRCADKAVAHRVLNRAGLAVPEQRLAADHESNSQFLQRHGALVVKPADGEQGRGISVNVRDAKTLEKAVTEARRFCPRVLLERYCSGQDLRVLVINGRVVAAAVRRPPRIVGDGRRSVRELIEKLSRRREAATGGESTIPLDDETRRCVAEEGYSLEDVLEAGDCLTVRAAANLHTGGTIHDVTDELHPELVQAALAAAEALDIPVVGLDFLVEAPDQAEFVIIEANERPGLANHEPQPTAERFMDLLFPSSRMVTARELSDATS
jgi:GNAT-family acetyltransferase (TIGR03103 family)